MATQEATPGSQSDNSALELPSARDIRDYMLQEASLEAPSEAVSSVEALSISSSSEVDPAPSRKMEAAEGEELLPPRLPELFDTCQRLLDEVEVAAEPTGSRAVQEKVLKGLHLLKQSAEMLVQLDSFSHNEDLEEIASSDLKYLMVPALQGALALKRVNPSKRLDDLQWAREHFLIYLTQCQHYHVAEFELPKTKNNSAESSMAGSSMAHPNLVAMASQRQAKIERYKQKKEMEHRLSAMKAAVESGEADDEHVREYYLLHLRRWIGISLEEIDSIDQEIKILREKDASKEASAPGSTPRPRPPMKPFILTRNAAQAKVFGAGYPSLASMTVNDWYDQRRKVGALPDQGIPKKTSEVRRGAQQHEEQEQKEEEDDEGALQRAREWDDWKDTHPRGYGNRQNMG
ncbi:shieldin complex subunit 1 isoform X1 [Phyllostomus discolor]|uniref:Shieldin complex subunit 1 isoform X1 n=2 Tax=Phyllostomus discolor TaxID=89673 RepID=A0A6J2MJB9_9CHIR|nr:shieldin complex subunit 1 isoform X1 [Phyllostomus discolor]XP_035865476.1 shieldin complex subunit 1 isoform X1 [Phyllostomus discolor]